MTAVSYHAAVNDLQDLPFAARGPFARLAWFAMLEHAGAKPLLALAREGNEAFALPLTSTAGGLQELSNWYAFTWRPLSTGQSSPRLLDALARDLARKTYRLTLNKLADEDGTASQIEAVFHRAGWLVHREICDTNHYLDIAGRSYAAFLSARPGALRTTLKRKAGKVAVALLTRFDPEAWAAYETVYNQSWKPEEGDPALLRRFAEAEGAAGRLRMALAHHEDAVIAAQFWTVEGETAYIHKLAHLESARALSPGTTLTAALFEQVIDRDGVQEVDFGTGDDGYKRDWMEKVRPRFRLTCYRPADPRNWPAIGKAALRRLVSRARAG